MFLLIRFCQSYHLVCYHVCRVGVCHCQNIISDGNIYYKEILAPCPNYSNIWTDTSLDKKIDKMSGFYNDYVNFVRMF